MQFNAFSFYLADVEGSNSYSFIDFNGFVVNNMKGGRDSENQIAWLYMDDSFFWQSKVNAVGFGAMRATEGAMNGDPESTFKFEGDRSYLSIFNTGTSFTLIPGELWVAFSDQIIQGA
jgi:hypothetical protein